MYDVQVDSVNKNIFFALSGKNLLQIEVEGKTFQHQSHQSGAV